MRYCKNCGLLAPYDTDRCPQCGTPLPCEPPRQSPAPQPAPCYKTPHPEENIPALSEWATLGTLLLFAIPVFGFILSLAWSFGFSKNPARKRLAQAWLIRTLVVTVVAALVWIFLAVVAAASFSTTYYYAY